MCDASSDTSEDQNDADEDIRVRGILRHALSSTPSRSGCVCMRVANEVLDDRRRGCRIQ